jgi:hypothetical protein
MEPLFRRGLLLVAASPLCLTGAFYLARITGLSIFMGGNTGAFWGVVAFASFSVLLLPVGATICAVTLIRARRAGEAVAGQALVASALVVGVTMWERGLLAREASPVSTGAPPAATVSPVATAAPHGGSGLLGVFLAVLVVVGAVVIMRRLRRMLE